MKKLLLITSLLFCTSIMAATHEVEIVQFAFSPSVLTVEVGDVIEFTNLDRAPHNVISRPESVAQIQSSPILQRNDTFTLPITESDSLLLHCGVHPMMPGLEINIISEEQMLIERIRSDLNRLETLVK